MFDSGVSSPYYSSHGYPQEVNGRANPGAKYGKSAFVQNSALGPQEYSYDYDNRYDSPQRHNNGRKDPDPLHKSWKPFWLRQFTLIVMTVLLVASAAGTLWLYIKSNNEKGLGSVSSKWDLVNIWKYLPTVVVVILLAVWHRIDFSTRILQPWANLRKGPASAEDTVFLDLLTPMLPTLIWTVSRIKAWPSMITILSVLLMGLVRALSTGLIQVNTISFVTPDFSLQKTASFDTSGWNAKMNDNVSATLYYGTWAQGLPWPEWTFGNATLEPLRPSLLSSETAGLPPNSTATLRKTMPKGNSTAKSHNATTTGNLNATSYTAITTGFFPHMECEEAHIDDRGIRTTNKNTYSANITFESSSCKVDVELPLLDPTAVNMWKTVGRNPERSFVGSFKQVACPDKSQKFLASVTLVDTNMKLVNSSSLFCHPSYSVKNVTVQVALPGNQPRVDWNTFERGSGLLDNMDPMVLLSHLVNSTMYSGFPAVKQPAKTSVNNDPFLRAASVSLLRADLDTIYLEPFLDPKVMELHIRNAYSGMAAITVQKRMLHAASDTSLGEPILGTSAHDEDRLYVPKGIAFPMAGLLVLCAILTGVLVVKRPNGVVPRDPRSIGGVGLILRNSSELHSRCENGLAQLQHSLHGARLSTSVSSSLSGRPMFVVNIDDNFGSEKQNINIAKTGKMWHPKLLSFYGRLFSIMFPLLFIAALEYL
ncbi:Aminopeptidase [Apiospora arundinis]